MERALGKAIGIIICVCVVLAIVGATYKFLTWAFS